jgi:hypothetical protein
MLCRVTAASRLLHDEWTPARPVVRQGHDGQGSCVVSFEPSDMTPFRAVSPIFDRSVLAAREMGKKAVVQPVGVMDRRITCAVTPSTRSRNFHIRTP